MFRHHRLHKHRAGRRIDAGREERYRHVARALPQVGRLVRHGDRVIVHDAEERFVLTLQRHPVLHRSEIVTNVQLAGRLDTAEDSGHRAKLTSERKKLQAKPMSDSYAVPSNDELLDVAVEAASDAAQI